jgi:hypothetical protein
MGSGSGWKYKVWGNPTMSLSSSNISGAKTLIGFFS